MQAPVSCSRCGASLAGLAPEGFCTACMLEVGLGAGPGSGSEPSEVTAPRTLGDYEMLEEIARGGMGVVFKARQISLGRVVAVKMILAGRLASEIEVQRFREEARAAASLRHPNIVAIHHIGEVEGLLYFTMDLVQGRNLAEAARESPFVPARAAACVRKIAEAIHYAHERGILHRDLKPSNVLLDARDEPHVTDFGLAKRFTGADLETRNEDLTLSGQLLGSPNFMSPEQAAGRRGHLTPASDIYSLGALLYYLLTGRPPFLADSIPATLRLVAETDPVAPRLLAPGVPPDLDTICLKCLEKDSHRRYATAQEIADELARVLRDEPIRARPVGRWGRFQRWTRRHPLVAGLTGVVIVLLAAVALVSTIAAARLQRANRDGQEKLREAYLSQARASRWSGRAGQRFDSLLALSNAAAIRPGRDLRNEAIAAMALVDVRPLQGWDVPAGSFFDFNREYDRYLRGSTNGPITLHLTADDRELARHENVPRLLQWTSLSPSGKFFSVYSGTNAPRLEVFRWGQTSPVLNFTNFYARGIDFAADEQQLAIGGTVKGPPLRFVVMVVDLSTGRTNVQFTPHTLPSVCLSPDADKVAVYGPESARVEIFRIPTGEMWQTLAHSNQVTVVGWPAGLQSLVVGAGGDIHLWNLSKAVPTFTRQRHGDAVMQVQASPDGELLASWGWNDQVRLGDSRTGQERLRLPGSRIGPFNAKADRMALWASPQRAELWSVAAAPEVNVWRPGADAGCVFSPDGNWIASRSRNGVRLWRRDSKIEVGLLREAGVNGVVFHPTEDELFTTSPDGLRRWSWRRTRRGDTNVLEVSKYPPLCNGKRLGDLSISRNGDRLAVVRDGWLEVYGSKSGESFLSRARQADVPGGIQTAALSPDGRWVATYDRFGAGAFVWDLAAQDKARTLVPWANGVAFSPNGQWLIVGNGTEYAFWDLNTWQVVRRIPRPINAGVHARAEFSPEGQICLLKLTERTMGLFDLTKGMMLTSFESPRDARLGGGTITPDGRFVTAPDLDSGGTVVWDLRAIRQRLASMKLDWDVPSIPPKESRLPPGPWRVTISDAWPLARDPRCSARQLDLAPLYDSTLAGFGRLVDNADNTLSPLPAGLQRFQGVDFDARGVVLLSGSNRGSRVKEISVEQACRRLHFLHAGFNLLGRVTPGATAGAYVVHWQDGETLEIPLRHQMNIDDWWFSAPSRLDTNTTVVAWLGVNAASAENGCKIQLQKFCWENPRPQIPIARVQFTSLAARLFLVAVTAE